MSPHSIPLFSLALVFFATANTASACNIPVFRYALERWKVDTSEAVVFTRGPLDETQRSLLDELRAASIEGNGTLNLSVSECDLNAASSSELKSLFKSVQHHQAASQFPCIVVRSRTARGESVVQWLGSLQSRDSVNRLIDSPARRELSQRLLRGDSVVWLLVKSPDEMQNQTAMEMLQRSFRQLQSTMELPEGIGLPGSELFSDVPLLIQFSVLEISRDDAEEDLLLQTFQGLKREALETGEPLLVPVFGRGRALEVIPLSACSNALIDDLTFFLGGACSCQVKDQNPGFDLLMNVAWNQQLFGDDGEVPPESNGNGDLKRGPTLLTIPPGRGSQR